MILEIAFVEVAPDKHSDFEKAVKRASQHGHLSNDQVADLLRDIAHPQLNHVVFGHLSSDCNRKDLVISHLRNCLDTLGHPHIGLHCAEQNQPTDWFAV